MVGQIALGSFRAPGGVAKIAFAASGLAAAVLLSACTSGGNGSAAGSAGSSGPAASSAGSVTGTGAAAPSVVGPNGPLVSSSANATSTSTPRPPSGGGINQTVPSRTLTTKAPVALDSAASFTNRITARISNIAAIKAVGHGPGEVTGPALRVTFTVTNGSKSAIDLGAVTADLTDSAGNPAVSMNGSPADPFRGSVAAGSSRKGVYVFAVATNRRKPVTVGLNYSASAPVVIFKGNAS